MQRELFVVEKLRGGQWVPRPNLVSYAPGILSRDVCESADCRIARYVPEDPTPRLLADWQDRHRGQVTWVSSADSTICILTSSDKRQSPGESVPCDPFGAARDALAKWEAQWP